MKRFNSWPRAVRGALAVAAGAAVIGAGVYASQHGDSAAPRVALAAKTDVNGYIAAHNIRPVKITYEWHKFSEFGYDTASGLPDGVVFHYTDDARSFLAREGADYEINGAWTSAFVHDFIDDKTILNIHDPDLGCWGAGPKANARFVQFELVTAANLDKFARSIANAASYTAQMLVRYGLRPSLVSASNLKGTIWTHHNVSTLLGGTNHVDPDAYIAKWGYTISDFLALVKKYYAPLAAAQPNSSAIKTDQYATITAKNLPIYGDLANKTVRANTSSYLNQVLHVKVRYRITASGAIVYSLYNAAGNWIGYLNATNAAIAAGQQGKALTDGRYVTVTAADATLWKDFGWHAKQASKPLVGRTFLSKVKYNHFNGSTYLSLYDANGKWQGYLNQVSATVAENAAGPAIPVQKTVTVLKNNYPIWNDLAFKDKRGGTAALMGQNVEIRAQYHHFNGSTYDAVYSQAGDFLGYLNDAAVGEQLVGPAVTDGRYVTVTKAGYTLWRSFDWEAKQSGAKLVTKTYKAKVHYVHRNGSTYLSLYDNQDKWQGYINQTGVAFAPDAGGVAFVASGYVALAKPRYTIWNNLNFDQKVVADTTATVGKIYQRVATHHHFNGSTYDQLALGGRVVGYINVDGVSTVAKPQGKAITDGRYVSVTGAGATTTSDFEQATRLSNAAIADKTYQSRVLYHHADGHTYLSLYDSEGKWQGYIDSKLVTVAKTAGGVFHSTRRYVTPTSSNYTLWQDFAWAKKRGVSKTYKGRALEVRVTYNHFNGSTYDSLYDSKGNWLGYINDTGVTTAPAKGAASPQGAAIILHRYATVVKAGVSVSKGFDSGTLVTTTDQLMNQTFEARVEYRHANGHTYVSLYQSSGEWLGYVDATAIALSDSPFGAGLALNTAVTVRRAVPILTTAGAQVGTTASLIGQSVVARQRFRNANGSAYYDLYTTAGKHLGLASAGVTQPASTITPVSVPADLYGLNVTALSAAQQAFLRQLVAIAIPVARQYDLYPSVMVMQAITESGWGTSVLATNANAYFGIKADANWQGDSYLKLTGEVLNGQAMQVVAAFRKYDSFAESIEGYAQKLTASTLYQGCLRKNAATWQQAVAGLATYATSPTYQSNLSAGITRYGLAKLDVVK